jgi:hypothetical protein
LVIGVYCRISEEIRPHKELLDEEIALAISDKPKRRHTTPTRMKKIQRKNIPTTSFITKTNNSAIPYLKKKK